MRFLTTLLKLLIIISIIYYFYTINQDKINGFIKQAEVIIDAKPAEEPTNFIENTKKAGVNFGEIGYFQRKIAGIMASFAETPEGYKFLNNMVKAQTTSSIADAAKFNEMIGVEDYQVIKIGKIGQTPKCGDEIILQDLQHNKQYQYRLGENKLVANLDAMIADMQLKEQRKIFLAAGAEVFIELSAFNAMKMDFNNVHFVIKNGGLLNHCGHKAKIDYKIYSHDKSFFYSNSEKQGKLLNIELVPGKLHPYLLKMLSPFHQGSILLSVLSKQELLQLLKETEILGLMELPDKDIFILEIKIIENNID